MNRMIFVIFFTIYFINFSNAASFVAHDPQIFQMMRRVYIPQLEKMQEITKDNKKLDIEYPKSKPFFCDAKNGPGKRSSIRPKSIHKLRPGDIDVVMAIGDSLTAGNGVVAKHELELYLENRGLVFSIGGQSSWRQFRTVPNFLKEFNPNIYGYSLRTSITTEKESKFNVAEAGADSHDILYQAKVLKLRLSNDPKVNMTNDWKMLSIFIGAVDFCNYACYETDPRKPIEAHRKDMIKTLQYLRDNIPRLMVNIIAAPGIRFLFDLNSKIANCVGHQRFECDCFSGRSIKWSQCVDKIVEKWQQLDDDLSRLDEFNNEEFTVNIQPFTKYIEVPKQKDGEVDVSYFALDCFHFSQKSHAIAAVGYWNNLLEPDGNKTTTVRRGMKFKCPTKDMPYIATKGNSLNV